MERHLRVTHRLLERWWSGEYGTRLARHLAEADVEALRRFTRSAWADRDLAWKTGLAWVVARRGVSEPTA